jgi:hypothetical protein
MKGAYSHVLLEARLEYSHGSQTTGSHGDIRKLVGRTMRSDSEEMRTSRVETTENEMGTNVSLVSRGQLGLSRKKRRKPT